MFTANAVDLRKAFTTVKPAVPRANGSALPVLQHCRIDFGYAGATVTATDLDFTITAPVAGAVTDPGAAPILLPHAATLKFLTACKRETVTVHPDGAILAGNGASLRGTDAPADEYPRLPQLDGAETFTADCNAYRAVAYAASTDVCRPILTAVCFQPGAVVATDSYRLACADTATEGPSRDLLVPSPKAVAKLFTGDFARCDYTEKYARFEFDAGHTVTVRLIEGTYPNYRGLFPPADASVLFSVPDAAALAAAVKTLPASKDTSARFEPDGEVSADGTTVRPVFTVPPAYAQAFNPSYLAGMLRPFGAGPFTLRQTGSGKPAVAVTDDGVTHLLMPVRIR